MKDKISRGDSAAQKKHQKKQSGRADRRAAKRDPENAPKKRGYRGWFS